MIEQLQLMEKADYLIIFIPSNAFKILLFLLIFISYCSMLSMFGLKLFFLSTLEIEEKVRKILAWYCLQRIKLGIETLLFYILHLFEKPAEFIFVFPKDSTWVSVQGWNVLLTLFASNALNWFRKKLFLLKIISLLFIDTLKITMKLLFYYIFIWKFSNQLQKVSFES